MPPVIRVLILPEISFHKDFNIRAAGDGDVAAALIISNSLFVVITEALDGLL